MRLQGIHFFCALAMILAGFSTAAMPGRADSFQTAQDRVAAALALSTDWDGPNVGPKAAGNKTIVFVAADLDNSGIAGVLVGVKEAVAAIGWQLTVIDAAGDEGKRIKALKEAAASGAAGIILGGFNALDYAPWIDNVAAKNIAVVGWHAAFEPGMVPGTQLFVNVATSAREVALAAASYAVVQGNAKGGFVIFTDSRFAVAQTKADDMAVIIRNCDGCSLLATVDLSLATVQERMPAQVIALRKLFGQRWTYALGINDLYFDAMATADATSSAGLTNVSAGDGSPSAFDRIKSGNGQMATVAEPLNLQGWQLIDELNRAFAGEGPSDYVPKAHLVVHDNINQAGGAENRYDPENGYRDAYKRIWGR